MSGVCAHGECWLLIFFGFKLSAFRRAGSRRSVRAFSGGGAWGCSSRRVRPSHCRGLSRCGTRAPERPDSAAVAQGLVVPWHVGFPRPGKPMCPHRQVDSQPLSHQGCPLQFSFLFTALFWPCVRRLHLTNRPWVLSLVLVLEALCIIGVFLKCHIHFTNKVTWLWS